MTSNPAADHWLNALATWAIPPEILDQAPGEPFVFPIEMFAAPEPGAFPVSGSSRVALDALGEAGVVLDVGCGGGSAAFALVPPATEVIGTDRQANMTELFARTAASRGVAARVFVGSWPDIAPEIPVADVVVCNNVLYNIPEIVPFCAALAEHARRRVVIELPELHPQTHRSALWKHFWDLDRPTEPSAWDAAQALTTAGFPVVTDRTRATERDRSGLADVEARFWTQQLCLGPERQPEVAAMLGAVEFPTERITIWWDTA